MESNIKDQNDKSILQAFYERDVASPMRCSMWVRVRDGIPSLLHDSTNGFSRIMQTYEMVTAMYQKPDGYGAPKNADIFINCDDTPPEFQPDIPLAAYSSSPGSSTIAIPSNVHMGWPGDGVPRIDEWAQFWLRERDVPFQKRADVLFWRGFGFYNGYRASCITKLQGFKHMDVQCRSMSVIQMREQSNYKYILDLMGEGWSGRLMNLMWMGAVIFIAERNLHEYWVREFFVPWKHYVPLKHDCSDAHEVLEQVMNMPDKGESIAIACRERASEILTEDFALRRLASDFNRYVERYGTLEA